MWYGRLYIIRETENKTRFMPIWHLYIFMIAGAT